MSKKLLSLFPEDIQNSLSEESVNAIQQAIDDKIQLNVEAALHKQDDIYSDKLKTLIKTIDQDRTKKLKRVVESVDRANAAKLLKVVKKYEREQLEEAKKFKKQLVSTVNAFLDEEVLTSLVSEQDFSQAVKNTSAFNILKNLQKVLSVDSVMMKESVKDAFVDGKKQLDEKDKQNKVLEEQNKKLRKELEDTKKYVFLSEKFNGLSDSKIKFIKNTFSDKSLQFVEENYDYVAKLYDRNEQKQKKVIKEEAVKNRKTKVDVVPNQKIVEEKVNNNTSEVDPYLTELQKVRKF